MGQKLVRPKGLIKDYHFCYSPFLGFGTTPPRRVPSSFLVEVEDFHGCHHSFPKIPYGLFNGVRGEAGRGAGIMTLAGRAGQGTTVASANWFKFWGQHWPRIWRLLMVVLWITRYEKCGTNDLRGVSDFPGAKLNGWRCWRNKFPNMTTVIPTKIEKCCSTILVRFCFLYFFFGGVLWKNHQHVLWPQWCLDICGQGAMPFAQDLVLQARLQGNHTCDSRNCFTGFLCFSQKIQDAENNSVIHIYIYICTCI